MGSMSKITINNIFSALTVLHNPFKNLVLTNVYVGHHEADYLVIRPSGWADEFEIKRSVVDFHKDFKKKTKGVHKHNNLRKAYNGKNIRTASKTKMKIRRFWFVVPEDILDEIKNDVPEYAGLIRIHKAKNNRCYAKVIKKAPDLTYGVTKWTNADKLKIYRKMYFRFWKRYKDELVPK
jgi:hypothetical protein